MTVDQTAGVPPNQGKMNLPIIGWTWKSKNAEMKTLMAKKSMAASFRLILHDIQRKDKVE
jgi:hypothetical protein